MNEPTAKQIQDRYRLETDLLRLQRQLAENSATLRQATFDLRTAQEQQLLYGRSLRSFADRISGKQEEKETAQRHEVQRADAALASARHQQEFLKSRQVEAAAELESIPAREILRAQADTAALAEWNRLEALFCAEALLPLLEDNRSALLEQRNMVNGANIGKIYTPSEQAEICTAPEKAGERCRPYILRLRAALEARNIPFPDCRYFEDPSAFVNAVVAAHNRRDRLNEAIRQVEAVLGLIPKLQKQLEN